MERILDWDSKPPYVEVFCHHPIMYMALCNQQQALQAPPRELVYWVHSVQCRIDDVAGRNGLLKIKGLGHQGLTCMFAMSPDLPPKQQAEAMLAAAKELRAALSQIQIPGSAGPLASQIAIHAGQYAGGVVGRSSWTYDLFGSDVQDLIGLDRLSSPGELLVTDAALALISDQGQFAPCAKVQLGGREADLHRWVGGEGGGGAHAWDARTPPVAPHQALPPSPVKRHALAAGAAAAAAVQQQQQQQQQQQPFGPAEEAHAHSGSPESHSSFASCSSGGGAGGDSAAGRGCSMQPDLVFADRGLEAAYAASQSQQLARLDVLFASISLALVGVWLWTAPAGARAVLAAASCGQWLVPALSVALWCALPLRYAAWREPLWAAHKVLSALTLSGGVVVCSLRHAAAWQGPAVAGTAAAAAGAHKALCGLLRRQALVMLVDGLGFRVRLRVHLLTTAVSTAVVLLVALWQRGVAPAAAQELLWDLMMRVVLGCLAPIVLLFCWELEERRAWRLERCGPGPQAGSLGRGAAKRKAL